MKVGFGFDVHRLVRHRKLVMGGVEIPFHLGLEGHSDADVLIHAIVDSILGALGLGDIGRHFPDTDPVWEGVESTRFLKAARDLLERHSFRVVNLDATVVAQEPKILPFAARICESIAGSLGIAPGQVNIKAKTTEGLGYIGEQKGMAAYAVVCIEEINREK